MNQSKFKPGQQWMSRDGKRVFHILSKNAQGQIDCICISDNAIMSILFEETGRYYKYSDGDYDLVTLVKDVE